MAEELEEIAAERVRARLGHRVDRRARMHAVLRRQRAGFRLEFLQRVGERQRQVQVVARVVVHRAIEHVAHAERQPAGQRIGLGAAAAAHGAAREGLHLRHRRRQILQQVGGVASVQRQVEDPLVVHHLADAEAARLDHLRVGLDGDGFGDLAERQGDRHDRVAVHLQHDARLHGGPEPLQRHFELVGADRDAGKRERAGLVGDDLALEPGIGLGRADRRPGKDAAARIFDGTGDLGGGLGQQAGGRQNDEGTTTHEIAQKTLHRFPPSAASPTIRRDCIPRRR